MKFSRGLISAAVAVGLIAVNVAPAYAALDPILSDNSTQAVGLIVKYKDGVAATAKDGSPTAENASGADLQIGRDLGAGWHSVGFDSEITAGKATSIAIRMAADPRVESVEIDRHLLAASSAPRLSAKAYITALAALKPATAVRSIKAVDAWSKATPNVAAVKVSWAAPASLFGASVSGYRVELNDGTGWKFQTSSLVKSAVINQGLVSGVSYSFRVAAITKKGGISKLGAFSVPVTAMPTSVPQPPVFTGSNTAFVGTSPSWAPQNRIQTGGLQLLGYQATAVASGQTPVICNAPANATTCQFTGLVPNVTYTVSVVAKNARGATASLNQVTPLDAMFKDQWYLTAKYGINATNAWSTTMGSKNVVVAVIDSGITAHPDLDNQVIPGYDFVSDPLSSNDGDGWDANNADPGDYYGNEPSSWHGTHVAGIIAAQSNSIGVTGVAPNVKIQPIRAMGSDGGDSKDLVAALHWAAGIHVPGVPDNKTPAQVVNLSMGSENQVSCSAYGGGLSATEDALASLKNAGVTVLTAAGNHNRSAATSYPGNCFPTINVGATAFAGERASYSNYSVLDTTGQMVGVDISAPGGDSMFPGDAPAETKGKIISTLNDGIKGPGLPIYESDEGTSMAAPIVAGVVALIYSLKPKITFDKVWDVLKATVTPFPAGSSCETKANCGAGIVNAGAAVAAALALP